MSAELLELPKDEELEYCVQCGSRFLDTGWECTDCGYDNRPWYYPEHNKAKTP